MGIGTMEGKFLFKGFGLWCNKQKFAEKLPTLPSLGPKSSKQYFKHAHIKIETLYRYNITEIHKSILAFVFCGMVVIRGYEWQILYCNDRFRDSINLSGTIAHEPFSPVLMSACVVAN